MSVDEFIIYHRLESPLLINPYFDTPSEYFSWIADDVLSEVEIKPLHENVTVYWNAAVELYGLNRLELKQLRYFIYFLYKTFKETLKDPGISAETAEKNRQAIAQMNAYNAPFAGMIRYFEETG